MDMFLGMLQGPYYSMMIGSTSIWFLELVMAGERVEVGIKMGKIQAANISSSNGMRKTFGGYAKKREGDANVMFSSKGKGKAYQASYQHATAIILSNYQQSVSQ